VLVKIALHGQQEMHLVFCRLTDSIEGIYICVTFTSHSTLQNDATLLGFNLSILSM